MFDRFYDELEIGASQTCGGVTVTEAHVTGFAELCGDRHPLHTDPEFARRSGYGQRIAQAFLVLGLALGAFPVRAGAVLALYGMEQTQFRRPTFLDDVISARLTVTAKTATATGGKVELHLEVLNQRQEIVVTSTLRLLVAGSDPTPPA